MRLWLRHQSTADVLDHALPAALAVSRDIDIAAADIVAAACPSATGAIPCKHSSVVPTCNTGTVPGHEAARIVPNGEVQPGSSVAMVGSAASNPAHWVEARRCDERFALQATAFGVRNAVLNPPVEVASLRPAFARLLDLGAGERPDLVVRFGRGATLPWSMRRPVQAVLR